MATAYYKLKEFADLFGLSTGTILEEIKRGSIKALRVGSQVLVPKEDYFTKDMSYKPMTRKQRSNKTAQTSQAQAVQA